MSLGDAAVSGQIKPWMRRSKVEDNPDSVDVSIAERLTQRTVRYIKTADAAAADTEDRNVEFTEGTARILNVRIIPDAALTANDTNYATLSIWDGTTTYASVTTETTGSGNWTDNVSVDVPVTTSNVATTTGLRYRQEKTGSGVSVPDCVVQILMCERIA